MKKISIVIIASVSVFINGCKKEVIEQCTCTNAPTPSSLNTNYHFPKTIGSYWIYENDNMDSTYNITSVAGIDSVFIKNDTVINGKTYFIKRINTLSGTYNYTNTFLKTITRDSSGYDVAPSGAFIKTDDFTNILSVKTITDPPPYTIVSRMANKDSVVVVPAGSFKTVNYFSKASMQDPNYSGNRIKYNYCIIANNVGVIYQTSSWYNSSSKLGIRLLRYHIAN
jgi:hypothetical protein